ncbi:beta-propeller domain-containing protein [Sunxiuqinia sp. A32]|uniref:beta-propeller domain-containing protein n=1 Tax=Sunxiuqinia sp. A32 TaxID=3461496 RepID=UPI0040463B28
MRIIKTCFFFAVLLTVSSTLFFCKGPVKTNDQLAQSTPCMDVLHLFTAPGVPELGPAEEFVQFVSRVDTTAPANLPGNGLAQHPMLYVGENCNIMFLIKDGKVIWTYSIGEGPEFDDIWMYSNGNILFTRMSYVALITPDKKELWRYDCNNSKGMEHTEIHACQPIGMDKVMFVESGLPPKLKVINIKTGEVEVDQVLPSNQPPTVGDIHPQCRRARYTADGTYLIPFLNMGWVIEYDKDFKEVWKYKSNKPWAAIRLKNGNTLITDEMDAATREVNKQGEVVWEFNCQTDLPAEYQFKSAPQTCTRLANGNTIFASRGAGGQGTQLIEVTPDKKVVWVLQDWTKVGDATAVQILDDPGIPEIPGQSEH